MKELLADLPICENPDYLLDTCFLVHCIETQQLPKLFTFMQTHKTAMSSFNLLELVHIHHKLHHNVAHLIHTLLKNKSIQQAPIDVRPGDYNQERIYVKSINPNLLEAIRDTSDAVLVAQAIHLHANVLSRDKHHIFTQKNLAELRNNNITIYKDFGFNE
ncbi:MAG: putative nucleic acid-binding protein [Candidatus Woesearchaeota archaeon]|jgi:predicted nucleic acid-binding protein